MIRAFLDSSVFFSACLSATGAAHELMRQGLRGRVVLVVSDLVLEETRRNLSLLPRRADEGVALFEQFLTAVPLERVEPTRREVLLAARYTDLKDAPIVAAAKRARVDYLVSLDRKHLVGAPEVARGSRLKIVLPGEVLARLRE